MRGFEAVNGYLEVAIWGDSPERVVNMALSRGIQVWDISQDGQGTFLLKVRIGGYKALRHLVRRCRCRMKIVRKIGLPFLMMRARKRKMLVSGLFFFCLMLYILGSFVWSIEVTGNKQVKTETILGVAAQCGLKVGVPKNGFDDQELTRELMEQIPELAWVGLQVRGTKVTIEVAEKTLPPAGNESEPRHLLARVDGTVEELLVLTGSSQVKEGSVVHRGEILIAGYAYPELIFNQDGSITPGGEAEQVRARGLVRARVIREKIGECPIEEEKIQDTGVETTVLLLRIGEREIILRGPQSLPYKHYRTIRQVKTLLVGRNPWGPVELVTIVYREQAHEIRHWGIEGAYREAANKAKEQLLKDLPVDYRIIDEFYQPLTSTRKDLVQVRYSLVTVEDIGCYRLDS